MFMEEEIKQLKESESKIKDYINKQSENGSISEDEVVFQQRVTSFINTTIIDVLESEDINKLLDSIAEKVDPSIIKDAVGVLALAMGRSSVNSIFFYDSLLKPELQKQFENYGSHLNTATGTIEAISAAIKVHSTKIGKLENAIKLNDINE